MDASKTTVDTAEETQYPEHCMVKDPFLNGLCPRCALEVIFDASMYSQKLELLLEPGVINRLTKSMRGKLTERLQEIETTRANRGAF